MRFGKIRARWRNWRIRRKHAKNVSLRTPKEVIEFKKAMLRGEMKAGRERKRIDANYYAGAADTIAWVLKEE